MKMTMDIEEKSPKTEKQLKPKKLSKKLGYLAIGASILITALIVAIRIGISYHGDPGDVAGPTVAEAKTLSEDKVEEEATIVIPATESVSAEDIKTPDTGESGDASGIDHWHFYNNDLQSDGEKLNDYDFGPNPILENISLDKVKDAIKGKKASDTVKVEDIIEMLDVE